MNSIHSSNKRNICLITNTEPQGGAHGVVVSLAQALSQMDHRVDVIILGNVEGYTPPSNYNFNFHIIETKTKTKNSAIKEIDRIAKYVQSIQDAKLVKSKISEIDVNFDLIVSNFLLANMTCKKLNLPNTYYCIHAAVSPVIAKYCNNKTGFFKFLWKTLYIFSVRSLYKNQNLITVSRGIEDDLTKLGIQPKTMRTIYNPFNFNDIKQQAKAYPVEEKDYIIHVGRFDGPHKRHDILIHAYKQSDIKEKLLLLGDDNKGNGGVIKQLVIDLELQDKVIFKGFNPNPYPYIKNAKAMVLSSDYEGLPTVLIESLILKTPVISTNCLSGPSEILIDKLEPFLSPIGDINALAKNIKNMVDNPVKITNKYIDKFSAEKSAEQYLSLCN